MRRPIASLLPFLFAACGSRVIAVSSDGGAPDAGTSVPVADASPPETGRDVLPPIDLGPTDPPLCAPGQLASCDCLGRPAGSRRCAADGRSYGPCSCPVIDPPPPVDGGLLCSRVTDPPRDTTSCVAPPEEPGGRAPYFQCTTVPVCPRDRYATDPRRPTLRVTWLQITQPVALASTAILNTINPTLARGGFLWGLDVDLGAGVLYTGALNPTASGGGRLGLGLMDSRYTFYVPGTNARYYPASARLEVADGRASAAFDAPFVLPIFTDRAGTSLLTELPLDAARIGVPLGGDGCVGGGVPQGGRYTETTSRWLTVDDCDRPYGSLDADISVANARRTSVTVGGAPVSLCNILSGANCETDPPAGWARQPDATVGGAPAYHLRATFAAISAYMPRRGGSSTAVHDARRSGPDAEGLGR